jgi:hypothetical protein
MKKLLEWAECLRPALLLCALVLSFAVAQLQAVTTIYVGKQFEVRDYDAPVKYVFNGQTRVAHITRSLSTNERIQRLRLRAGWNLVSLAVTAPDFLDQLQEFTSGPAPVIQALYRWQPATRDHGTIASGESVTAGTVLWVSAQADAVVFVRGAYVEITEWRAPASGTFVAVPALEAQPLQLPAGVIVWRYDAQNRRWQAGLTGDLASVSDLPPTLAPGQAIYVHSNEPADLGAPTFFCVLTARAMLGTVENPHARALVINSPPLTVARSSRPLWSHVSLSWSMPMRCRMVAWISCTWA